MDVQQKEFRVSRMGGYKMRDVDEFLDEITASMTSLLAENERLRSSAGAAPVLGSPDLDDVARQADEIIQRARDEAAQILADARAGAVTAAAMGGGGDRGAINAFLVQEREFLQGLAALVQGHADSVKGMAKAARSAATAREETAGTVAAASVEAGAHVRTPDAEPAPEPEPEPEPEAEPEAVADTAPEVIVDGAPVADEAPAAGEEASADEERTIRIDDPQPAAASAEAEDGSLRELFWGEED
jgi:DivIVA domain-containing protein